MIESSRFEIANLKFMKICYLTIKLSILATILSVSASFANDKTMVPVISLLLGNQNGIIESQVDLSSMGYRVNYGNMLLEINSNRFNLLPDAEKEIPILLAPNNEPAGYGRLVDGQYRISPRTTAFYFFDKIVPHISQLDPDLKKSLYKRICELQSFSQLETILRLQEYSPLIDNYTAIMTQVIKVLDEIRSPPTSLPAKVDNSKHDLKNTIFSTPYKNSPFVNGISLQDIDINYISDDEINVKVNVRSKNLSYMVAHKANYNFQTKKIEKGSFVAYIEPKKASNLLSSFTSVQEIQQNFSDMASAYHHILDYGFLEGGKWGSYTASPGDSSNHLDLKMSCQYNTLMIEGDTLESILYSNVQIIIYTLDILEKLDRIVPMLSENAVVKQVLAKNNITPVAIAVENFKKFKKEFTKRIVIELLKNDKFRKPLVTFVTSGDYKNLAENLFSLNTVHETLKAAGNVMMNLITDNKFGLLPGDEIADIALGVMDIELRLLLSHPEEFSGWPSENELLKKLLFDPEMQDALLKKASKALFKYFGLEAYQKMLSATTTLSDTWMLAFGIANPPYDSIFTFSEYFPECGETSINISTILPKQATVGTDRAFVLFGTSLSRVSTVTIENCTDLKILLRENERIAIECTPTSTGQQSIYYGIEGSSEAYLAPAKALFVNAIKEPVIDKFTNIYASLGKKHSFSIQGSNLENIVNLQIQDCTSVSILTKSKNLLTAECSQFIDDGLKSVEIIYNSSLGHKTKSQIVFDVKDTQTVISNWYPKNLYNASSCSVAIFGNPNGNGALTSLASNISIRGLNLHNISMICESNINDIDSAGGTTGYNCLGHTLTTIGNDMASFLVNNWGVEGIKRVYFFDDNERQRVTNGSLPKLENALQYIDISFQSFDVNNAINEFCPPIF